ncbi:RagB/SusD family nutrient uptake outer membrane protein [Parabacteroides segnis]|uniref:RagB/SusD family nutrient uptake outer membrane protein n=1 Tax=Parabacteroides segnis TaxID=2763058 RepID=UPI003519A37C
MKSLYKTVKIMSLAVLTLSLSNCTDELTTNSSTAISEETILSSTNQLNMVLNSVYKYILMGDNGSGSQNDACYAGLPGYCMYYDLTGADIMSTTNYGGSPEMCYRAAPERTQSTGDYSKRIWVNMYKAINQANIILDALPDATGEDSEKNDLKGQCLAIRGICYFNLIMNYQQTYAIAKDKRGVILRTSSSDPESMGFSTVQQCYDQILKDLKEAKTLLAGYDRTDMWRLNADVVSGQLARVYQVMGDWSNALSEAKSVYDKYNTLMTENEWYSGFDNFLTDGCKEVIWGVKYTNLTNISSNTEFNYWYNQDPSYGEGMTDGPIYCFINLLVDGKYVELFDDGDYRGRRCDKTTGVTDADVKNVMFWHRANNGDSETRRKWAYNKFKYYGDANGAKQGNTYPELPLMRGSEMLLIMAEAEANQGNTGTALSYLTTLQSARNVANLTTTTVKDDLLEAIYVERRKELLGEGVTGMYDLLRLQKPLYRYGSSSTNPAGHYSWGMMYLDNFNASDAQPYGYLPSNDYRFICQIPQLELANNEVISNADQNPFSGQ